MQEGKEKCIALLEFLDCKILDPILEASPELYSSQRDRIRLAFVQKRIAMDKENFHSTVLSPHQICQKYYHQIYCESYEKLGKELEDLELPRFLEMKSQFFKLCKDLEL